MSLELKAGPTSLERLETAIARMVQKHGFFPVDRAPKEVPLGESEAEFTEGLTALLLTDDPQRNLEVLDACVILPEALKPLGEAVARRVAGPEVSQALMQRYGVARAPAVVFLRDGQYLGVLQGIRDWREYQEELARLLAGPAQPKPIGIPVRAANPQGACA
jgi:hydrogenase-1 operon protein HyaE